MLKFDVPDDLLEAGKEGELFFAQRVAELTYMYTRESYRVSTTTVPFLARECLAVIDDHISFELNISGVERVLAELKRRSQHNVLVQKLARMPIDFYFNHEVSNLSQTEDCIRVFAKELSPLKYVKEACDQILGAAANEKEKINFLASELICTLVNLGVSREYIYQETCRIFFKDPKSEQSNRIDDFIKIARGFSAEPPEFLAVIPIKAGLVEINEDILKLFRAEIIDKIPGDFVPPRDFEEEIQGRHLILMKGVISSDYISAANFVKRNIVRLHDLLGLFYHKGSNEVGPCIMIAKHGSPETSVRVRSDQNLMQMISDNPKTLAARKLETMIKTLRLPGGDDREKFFRVVDFHGMSLGSPIPENQLINLWTSLETIAPSLKGKSIIGSVCKGALPIIGIQYISRTFITAANDIKRWDNKKFKSALRNVINGENIVEKTFLSICDPNYDEICTSLLAEMHDFPLLRYRIFNLNKRFKSGKSAAAEVRLHMTKAEQQLHRIYRARNSIVHSAKNDQLTENLIISAHEYFDQVFSFTVELCSKPFMFDNYRDAFNYSDMAFNSYIKILDDLEDAPVDDAGKFVWRAS